MSRNLQCTNGHEWTAPDSTKGTALCEVCPKCSQPAATPTAGPPPEIDVASATRNSSIDDTSIVRELRLSDPNAAEAHAPIDTEPVIDRKLSIPESSSSSPPQLPGYEILDEIGQGATGVVYRARHLKLNRIVALKILATAGHSESLKRARTECEAVAHLQHPNIVQIFEVHEASNAFFIAFEYVAGGTLTPSNITSYKEAAELLELIGRGIQHAHELGVVHRDLKPANILMTTQGVPKIADFGLAKRQDVDVNHTQAGSIMGTPHYMAPEQAYGRVHRMGPATDVYALGTILYELLTQQKPFDDPDLLVLLQRIRTAPPVPPRQRGAKIPNDLETICLKCLEKRPWNRYSTAGELADDLRRFLDGRPIEAIPDGKIRRSAAWLRRHGKPLVTTLAVTSAVLAIWFVVAYMRNLDSSGGADVAFVVIRPTGLPAFSIPMDSPLTNGKVELGRKLFFDSRLSADGSIACVSCHHPDQGWSDANNVSHGIRQQAGHRNSISVANVAYQQFLFWDGRAETLEEQALLPLTNPAEMGMASLDDLCERLNGISGYRALFEQIFADGVTPQNIGAALTAFERTLVAGDSPYDRFQAGDESALSSAQVRGMQVFFNAGHCSACHSGPLFNDGGFHNIGIGQTANEPDLGRNLVTGRRGDRGSFKTPSLRDLTRTAPYMHDGSLGSLEEVIEYYNAGGTAGPQLDEDIYPLRLTTQQKSDLVEFLAGGLRSRMYPESAAPDLPN